MNNIEINITDNTGEVIQALEQNLDKTLEMLGLQAAGYAQLELESDPARIDTGLLRNSITYAIAGEAPKKTTYKADKADSSGSVQTGSYNGSTTKSAGEHAVYIGTNVEYAPYVHEGFRLPSGAKVSPNRFIRNAVEKHIDEEKKMIEKGMKGEL